MKSHNLPIYCNHKKVQRIMNLLNLKVEQHHKNSFSTYKGEIGKVAKNLLKRNFKAKKPFKKMGTDITEFNCTFGKAYLSLIVDMYNNEIVSWILSRPPDLEMVMQTIGKMEDVLPNECKTILHSDQGWHYQTKQYVNKLKELKIKQSMSRKGNCNDNGPTESIFGVTKNNMFYGKEIQFKTFEDLKKAIEDYVYWNNHVRPIKRLGYLSPVEFKRKQVRKYDKIKQIKVVPFFGV